VVDDGLDAGVEVDTGEQSVAEVVVDGVCVCVCVCVCVFTTARPAQDVDRGPTMARVILTQTLSSRDQTGLETTVSVSVSVLVSRVLASVSRLCLQGPDLQNILQQSYDYLTIMSKLRSTYDGCLIYKNILRRAPGFS